MSWLTSFTPSSWSSIYIKNTPQVPEFVITFNAPPGLLNVLVTNIPDWLMLYNFAFNSNTNDYTFKIKVNQAHANTMQVEDYEDEIKIRYTQTVAPWDNLQNFYKSLPVHLEVQDSVTLNLNPTVFSIPYLIGDPLPQNSILEIQSDNNWTAQTNQSWLSVSQTSGYLSAQISVIVDPTGLTSGNYEGLITVSGVQGGVYATVLLYVSEGDTDTNYLYLNPQNFAFISEFNVASQQSLNLNIDVSHSWNTVISHPWLVLSQTSGDSGVHDLALTVVNVPDLPDPPISIGDYAANIEFTSNGITKTIYITHKVIEFLNSGIASNTLYFSDDINKLLVTSAQENIFLTLDVITNHVLGYNVYNQQAPYFQGLASIPIGVETKHFLKSVIPTNNFTSRIKNNIVPISLDLTAWNVNKIIQQVTNLFQYQNIKFLNGKTPTVANKLCYTPSTLHVTKNAILSLSVLAENNPQTVVITGDADATISTALGDDLYVYNAIINLTPLNLSEGDTINIAFADISVDVFIKASSEEQTIIAFENEWNEYELFEATGFLTDTPDAKKTTTVLQVEDKQYTKIVSIDNGNTYTLNTGWIHSQEEVDWLTKILTSERVFIYKGTEPIEVELLTKKLERYQTSENKKSFNLKFKKALI